VCAGLENFSPLSVRNSTISPARHTGSSLKFQQTLDLGASIRSPLATPSGSAPALATNQLNILDGADMNETFSKRWTLAAGGRRESVAIAVPASVHFGRFVKEILIMLDAIYDTL